VGQLIVDIIGGSGGRRWTEKVGNYAFGSLRKAASEDVFLQLGGRIGCKALKALPSILRIVIARPLDLQFELPWPKLVDDAVIDHCFYLELSVLFNWYHLVFLLSLKFLIN